MRNPTRTRLHPLDGVQRQPIKITDLKAILLSYPLKREEQWADGDNHFVIWQTTEVIVQVFTDVGLVGLGGASRYRGPAELKRYAEEVIRPRLLGQNPFDVEYLAGGMCAHGPAAIWSAVDVALWDIIGKAVGQPLYKLLAIDCEPVTHLRVYASGGEYSWKKGSRFPGPEDLIEQARTHQANGYTAFKFRLGAGRKLFGITVKDYIPYLYRIREAVGPNLDLIQEANGRLTLDECLELAPVLEELRFLWFEEPTSPRAEQGIANYLRVKQALPTVKVSGGEGRASRMELAEWMDRGAYDIVQQGTDDAGLTEAWYMARAAHARGLICCPHNWQGGMVTISNAHLMAALPNRLLLESNMTPNSLKEGLFVEPLAVKNGYLDIGDKPGLGVELRAGLEQEYPYLPGSWHKTEEELG